MPHSSGGGHSGGGFHGAGGQHSHYVSPIRTPSASPYLFYYCGMPRVLYADTDITSDTYRKEKKIAFWICLVIALAFSFFAIVSCAPGSKLEPYAGTKSEIVDELGVIDNSDVLLTKLDKYAELTGMYTVILTVQSDKIVGASDLEDYAYHAYVSRFPGNERMWLIVYTEDFRGNAFAFEGMQGDQTDGVLPDSFANRFNRALTASLDDGQSVGDAFSLALDVLLSENPLKWHFEPISVLFLGFISLLILAFGAVPYLQAVAVSKGHAQKVSIGPDEDVKTMARYMCENCRKRYIRKFHKTCPFCGTAPSEPKDNPYPGDSSYEAAMHEIYKDNL